MTQLTKEIADDWEWDIEDAGSGKAQVASLFGRMNGLTVNVPYNGHDGDLAEQLEKYHLSNKERSELDEILKEEKDDDDFDVTLDEYVEMIEDELHCIGRELSATFEDIYGKVPKKNKKLLDFPDMHTCSEITKEKDPARWCMYIGIEY